MPEIDKFIHAEVNNKGLISKAITDVLDEFRERSSIKRLNKIDIYITKDPLRITKKIIPKRKISRHGEMREWLFEYTPSFSYLKKGKNPAIMLNANESVFETNNHLAIKGLFAHELMHLLNKIDGIEDELEEEAEKAAGTMFYLILKHEELKPFNKEKLFSSFVRITATTILFIKDILANSRAMSFGFDENIYEYYKESIKHSTKNIKFTEKSIMKELKKGKISALDNAFLTYLGLNNTWITFKMFHHDKWYRKLKKLSNIEVPDIMKKHAKSLAKEFGQIRSGGDEEQIAKVLKLTQQKYFNIIQHFCKKLK